MALTHTDTNIENLKINKFNTLAEFEAAQAQSLIGNYDISLIGEVLQTDWGQNNSTKEDYIKNRTHFILEPTIANNPVPVVNEVFAADQYKTFAFTLTSKSNNLFDELTANRTTDETLDNSAKFLSWFRSLTVNSTTVFFFNASQPIKRITSDLTQKLISYGVVSNTPFIGNAKVFFEYFYQIYGDIGGLDPNDYDTGEDYFFMTVGINDYMVFMASSTNTSYNLQNGVVPTVSATAVIPNVRKINNIYLPDSIQTIPTPTQLDSGKLLSVNANGEYELITIVNSENISY